MEEILLEAQVMMTQEGEGGGGIKLWVFNADGKIKVANEAVQKLSLKLKPVTADGNDLLISKKRKQRPKQKQK